MADLSCGIPLVMGKAKINGCWCMAQIGHALGRLKTPLEGEHISAIVNI